VLVVGGTNFRREFVDSAELYDPLVGNWSATGNMNVARFSHTAIVLPDGKVLVVGGYGDDPIAVIKSLNSAELYDPITGTWSMTGSIRDARVAHIAALLLNGKVLVAGGNDGKHGDSLGSAELYDPSTGNWTVTGSLSYANQHFTASTLANGKVLVAGGLGDPVAQLYDPSTETWSPTGRMNASRQDHTACMLKNGEVLVAGGSTYGIVTNGAELYDPSTETWRITASMNAQRQQHDACTLANGKVLVVGGTGTPDTAELFSP
jgi:N-acetylneuraminic acid mutarotase